MILQLGSVGKEGNLKFSKFLHLLRAKMRADLQCPFSLGRERPKAVCSGTPQLGSQRRVTCLGVGREGGLERERFGGRDKAKVRMLSALYEEMQTQNSVKGCRTQSGLVSALLGTLQETFSQRYSFHLHGAATAKQKCQKPKLKMATMVGAPSLWQPEYNSQGQGCWWRAHGAPEEAHRDFRARGQRESQLSRTY